MRRENAALRATVRAAAGVAAQIAPFLRGVPPEKLNNLRWLLTMGVGLASDEPAPDCPAVSWLPPNF